jgi:hypothetical protein
LTAVLENELSATHGAGWTVVSSGPSGVELNAQIAALQPGETASLRFGVVALVDIAARRTHAVNTASVASATPDAEPSNDETVVETVIPLP